MNDEEWFSKFQRENQGSFVEDAVGAIKFGLQKVEDTVETVIDKGAEILKPIVKPVDEFFNITEGRVINGKQMPSGLETMQSLAEASYDVPYQTAKDLGAPEGVAVAAGVAGSLLEPSPFGEAKAATVAGELLSKAKPIKAAVNSTKGPTQTLQPQFATINGSLHLNSMQAARTNLEQLASQPLKVASNMEVSGWEKSAKTLIKEGAAPEQIKRVLARPYHKDLSKSKYEYVSLDDIAKDKDGWLTVLIDRAEQLGVDMAQYHKLKKQKKNASNWQREMYDRFMDNPLDTQGQMYNPNNPVRKAVAKTFTAVLGKEWHHIFGNKEGAESIMSIVAQDPYIAANLFSHMKKIGLSSSGKADNIALMKMKAHRGRGDSYHAWARALGLEGRGKRADAVISEYMQEISKSILAGETSVEELFSMLSLYKKVVDSAIKPKIKTLGGEFADEMKGVGAFALGKTKRKPLVKTPPKAR